LLGGRGTTTPRDGTPSAGLKAVGVTISGGFVVDGAGLEVGVVTGGSGFFPNSLS
jgi:hypothetical protein